MARETARTTCPDADRHDLIKLIGRASRCRRYRFLLFADKRRVELVERQNREVCTAVLPFPDARTYWQTPKGRRSQAELGFDMRWKSDQGVDEQAHLGRQQTDSLIPQAGATPSDRRSWRSQAHLH